MPQRLTVAEASGRILWVQKKIRHDPKLCLLWELYYYTITIVTSNLGTVLFYYNYAMVRSCRTFSINSSFRA